MLITSELTNQSARKALFTCVVYTNYYYYYYYIIISSSIIVVVIIIIIIIIIIVFIININIIIIFKHHAQSSWQLIGSTSTVTDIKYKLLSKRLTKLRFVFASHLLHWWLEQVIARFLHETGLQGIMVIVCT